MRAINTRKIRLGDMADVILGGTPKTSIKSYWDGDIPWISVKDMNCVKHIYKTERTITEKGVQDSNTKLMEKETIIISARGSVGKIVVLPMQMAFNQSCYAICPKNAELYNDYLYYNLKYCYDYLNKVSHGAVFNTIITDTLNNLELNLPSVTNQKKVASVLSVYDNSIENNNRRIKILEEMAQTIYDEWFVKFRFPGHSKVKMVDSELGRIPEGWEVKKLEDASTIKGGKKLSANQIYVYGKYPVFGGNGIQGYSNNNMYEGFVIAFGRVGAYCGSIHWSYDGAWLNNNASSIIPNSVPELLLGHLLRFNFNNLRGGSAQPFISNSSLASIKLIFPPSKIGNSFCDIVKPMRLQVEALKNKNKKLSAMRDLLLPKLISGEIDVEDMDIDIGDVDDR